MKLKYVVIPIIIFALKANISYSQNTIGLLDYSSESSEGYTLFAPVNNPLTFLIDNCGFLVNVWKSDFRPGLMCYLLEDGSLLRGARITSNFTAGGSGGRVEKISWENELIWSYDFSTEDHHSHHDLAVLPNGNFLILLWDRHSEEELIKKGRNTNFLTSSNFFWSEKIFEIKPIGTDEIEIVWEWNSWDHLTQDYDQDQDNFGVIADHPERLNINYPAGSVSTDWLHMNAIDYNPQLDQIIVNSRNMNEFYLIDHTTTTEEAKTSDGGLYGKGGDILFRWGNPMAYDQGEFQDQKLFGQHDANWIQEGFPGEGNILIFNNGLERPELDNASSVEEIMIDDDLDGFYELNQDGRYGPDSSLWIFPKQLTSDFYSRRTSGAHRQANGSTLICNGQEGLFSEIDHDGNILWQYQNPISFDGPLTQGNPPSGSDVFKIRRYNYDYPAFTNREIHPVAPIELLPSLSDCITTDAIDLSIIKEYNIYPNPFQDIVNLNLPDGLDYTLEIFNQVGQKVYCKQHSGKSIIDTELEFNGIYLVKITDTSTKRIHTKTMIKL